jgi:hypothetical protein
MKHTIIFSAFLFIVVASGGAAAQGGVGMGKVSVHDTTSPSGVPVGIVTFQVDGGQTLQIFESVFTAGTEEECFARTDFPNPRSLGPERATIAYNEATRTYTLKWTIGNERADTCRVLRLGQSVDSADYVIWRRNLGSVAGLSDDDSTKDPSARTAVTQGRGVYVISTSAIGPF